MLAFGWAALPAAAWGQEPPTQQQELARQETGREHVVRRGDTLWDLARTYLSNPFLWPTIFEANRRVVRDPHWIYPNDRLSIPPFVPTAVSDAARTDIMLPPLAREPVRSRWYRTSAGAIVNEEGRATVLETVEQEEPYAVPPAEWHSTPFLADSAELGVVGRVVALDDPRASGDVYPAAIHPFDRVHVGRLQGRSTSAGDTLVVVRFGDRLGTEGRVVEPLALLRVDAVGASVVTATVVHQFEVSRVGDAVMPRDPAPATVRGEPRAIEGGPAGRLIGFANPALIHGTTNRAFIDIGRAGGVAMGDELIAYLPERGIADGPERLPPVIVAMLRVVKVRDRSATVRVVDVRNTALDAGLPVQVVRRTAN